MNVTTAIKKKYKMSFGWMTLIDDNIVEVVIDQGVNMSLEMAEEYSDFLSQKFTKPFAILVNKINQYSYSMEARLILHSDINLKAVAAIEYEEYGQKSTQSIIEYRKVDQLNIKSFSGLELGWQDGLEWLRKELST